IDPVTGDPYHQNVQPVISADQMREIDLLTTRDFQITSLSLMQAAAAACFDAIATHFEGNLAGKRALVLCGPGNNGGDGAALALALEGAGVHVEVVLFGKIEDTSGDARTNFELVGQRASRQTTSTNP